MRKRKGEVGEEEGRGWGREMERMGKRKGEDGKRLPSSIPSDRSVLSGIKHVK